VVKEHQRRRVVRRTTCRCRSCGGRTTPRSLPAPYDRSKVTCEWLAWLVHQKFGLLTPRDDPRAVQFLRAHPYDRRHGRDRTRANRTFLNFGNRTLLYFSYIRCSRKVEMSSSP